MVGRRGASGRGRKPAPSKKESNSAAATYSAEKGGGGGSSSSSSKKATTTSSSNNNNNDVSSDEDTSEVREEVGFGSEEMTLNQRWLLFYCRTNGPRARMQSEGKRRR